MESNLSDEEREKLRLDNEVRKIKMELEKGAKFIEDPDMPSLPPEIENEFLNYIEQFEQINEQTPRISLYELIGKPAFRKVDELDDEELNGAMDELMTLLHTHQIDVCSIHGVEEREMYRFLTEDLFNYEMVVMKKMKGMMTQFTYEEFYPDDVKDVIVHIENFFNAFLDLKDGDTKFRFFTDLTDPKNDWLLEFRAAYDRLTCHRVNVHTVQISDDENLSASALCEVWFDAYTTGKPEKHVYKGDCNVELLFTPGGWSITTLQLPRPE